jgi:hypothetical protein
MCAILERSESFGINSQPNKTTYHIISGSIFITRVPAKHDYICMLNENSKLVVAPKQGCESGNSRGASLHIPRVLVRSVSEHGDKNLGPRRH